LIAIRVRASAAANLTWLRLCLIRRLNILDLIQLTAMSPGNSSDNRGCHGSVEFVEPPYLGLGKRQLPPQQP
jgi:hypothetical protein